MKKFPRKISFTREGLFFTLFTFPVGLAAINTGNNMLYLVLGMLLSIIAINGIFSEACVKHIQVACRLPAWIFAGDSLVSFGEVENAQRHFPSYLVRVAHLWETRSDQLRPLDGFCVKLAAKEKTKLRLESRISQRGIYQLKGFRVATRFPFGLFDKIKEIDSVQEVFVYPKVRALSSEESGSRSDFGDVTRESKGRGEDLYALRNYQRGDDARHIHWKASAKTGRLILRELAASGRDQVAVLLETRLNDDTAPEKFERQLSEAASLIFDAYQKNLPFGLYAPEQFFEISTGGGHFHEIMRFLASLAPSKSATNSYPHGASFQKKWKGEGDSDFIRIGGSR